MWLVVSITPPAMELHQARIFGQLLCVPEGRGGNRWFPSNLPPTGGLQRIARTADALPATVENVRLEHGGLGILVFEERREGADVGADRELLGG